MRTPYYISLGFETFAIEYLPFRSEKSKLASAGEDEDLCEDPMALFCEHMDLVKKLKGQDDPYKDAFSKVYRFYQPI